MLGAVNDANETKLERVDATVENIESVCAGIHQIELCENADSSSALWIDRAGKFKGVRVSEVNISGRDGENDAIE